MKSIVVHVQLAIMEVIVVCVLQGIIEMDLSALNVVTTNIYLMRQHAFHVLKIQKEC